MGEAINFFNEDVTVTLKGKRVLRKWLNDCATEEGVKVGALNYIFCSDSYLLAMNRRYLNHDTFTDIITFPMTDTPKDISGDIFISFERVRENAREYGVAVSDELARVMVHGMLHLLGLDDKTATQKKRMRSMENQYLEKLNRLK